MICSTAIPAVQRGTRRNSEQRPAPLWRPAPETPKRFRPNPASKAPRIGVAGESFPGQRKHARHGVRPLFATEENTFGSDRRKGPPVPMQSRRLAPQLSQRRNNASVVTANNGLTPCGLRPAVAETSMRDK